MLDDLAFLEKTISDRAASINARHAFMIILDTVEYETLEDIFNNLPSFFNHRKYPWCSIKILADIAARFLDHNDSLHEKICQKFNGYGATLWDDALNLIRILKLEESGRVSNAWYLYSNIILHAGVPMHYTIHLFKIINEAFDNFGDGSRVLDSLCDNKELFKYAHFSQYFKRTFDEPYYRRLLFRWLISLKQLPPENIIKELEGRVPLHLLKYLSESKKSKLQKHINNRKTKSSVTEGLHFNFISLSVDYCISIPESFSDDIKIDAIDSVTPAKWLDINFLKTANSSNIFLLPLSPSDLPKRIRFKCGSVKRFSVFPVVTSQNPDVLVFDERGIIISPNASSYVFQYLDTTQLIILSKTPLQSIYDQSAQKGFSVACLEDLRGSWFLWYHYTLNFSESSFPITLVLPAPYDSIRFSLSSHVASLKNEVISNHLLPEYRESPCYGGPEPPQLQISHENLSKNNTPYFHTEALYSGFRAVVDGYSKYVGDGIWMWVLANESIPQSMATAKIQYTFADISFASTDNSPVTQIECNWYRNLGIEYRPNKLLLPTDQLDVVIKGSDIKPIFSEFESSVLFEQFDNRIEWKIKSAPHSSCIRVAIKYKGEPHEFFLRLPYLTIWIKSKHLENPVEFKNATAFDENHLLNIYDKDKYSRACFFSNGFIGDFALLFDNFKIDLHFTKDRNLIDISLGDILKHGTVFITDNISLKSIPLINSINKQVRWSGKRINTILNMSLAKKKNVFIYLPEEVR